MQAAILSGGKGTRLSEVSGGLPKALVEVEGKTLIGRQLELLAASGCTEAIVLAGHGADLVDAYCGDGSRWGLKVHCVSEKVALGTAGAVLAALDSFESQFLVLYADTVLDVDLVRFRAAHTPGSAATLFLHPNDHPQDSDLVEVEPDGRVRAFHPYPHPEGIELPNLVNAALYVLDRDALAAVDGLRERPDFGKHVFPRMLELGMRINGYRSPEYIKDAGTPKRLAKVELDLVSGRVAARSLRLPQPAVFIDRDGVLNEERDRISHPQDLTLIPRSAEGLARLNDSDYRAVVVTNQPVVARGDCTIADLARIHARLDTLLGQQGAYVDALFACPHHPDRGFAGEVTELKIVCDCRKPRTGLIDRAVAELNIDLRRSWMIGDTTVDMELARKSGLRSVLVRTGHAGLDNRHGVMPDFTVPDLAAAADLILDAWPAAHARCETIASTIPQGAMVLVGGAARSGKSTFAGALAITMRERGQQTSVLSLDHWIRSEHDRRPSVLGRYDLGAAAAAIRALLAGETVTVPGYDERERVAVQGAKSLTLQSGHTLVVEGVPALLSDELGALAGIRVHISIDEATRRARFYSEYRRRGTPDEEIEQLYVDRNADETPLVAQARGSATYIIESSE